MNARMYSEPIAQLLNNLLKDTADKPTIMTVGLLAGLVTLGNEKDPARTELKLQANTYKGADQFFEVYVEGELLEPVVDPGTILVINVGEMHELTSADLDRIAFTDQQEAKRLVEMYQDNVGDLIEEY